MSPDEAALRMKVVSEVMAERSRQIELHGRTREHDDRHSVQEWAYLLLRRVTDLSHPWPEAHLDVRREFIEIAAIAVAAIESMDRLEWSAEAGGQEPVGTVSLFEPHTEDAGEAT